MKNDWTEAGSTLQKTFEFRDFSEALAFVNKVGRVAERFQHHPDICIKDYKQVFISTTTHEGSRITSKDRELVEAIESIIV